MGDALETHFWMLLVTGQKRWRVYPREDAAKLGFSHFTNSFPPNAPLANLSQPWEFVQQPGQLVVVPHGLPHTVVNLETTVAVAGNFVDGINWNHFVEEVN